MARFELATSSLPRRHTAGLCHIGIYFRYLLAACQGNMLCRLPFYRLLNNVVSYPYKTLRKDCGIPGGKIKKSRKFGE
jgi:hypothetical protein